MKSIILGVALLFCMHNAYAMQRMQDERNDRFAAGALNIGRQVLGWIYVAHGCYYAVQPREQRNPDQAAVTLGFGVLLLSPELFKMGRFVWSVGEE